jgi:hypothetical protein
MVENGFSVVPTGAARCVAQRRGLFSTICGCLLKKGPSTPRFALQSGRRETYARAFSAVITASLRGIGVTAP